MNISNNDKIILIAGPCQMESKEHAAFMCKSLKEICEELEIGFIFKTSFDKANRTSAKTPRGLGLKEAVPVFQYLKKEFKVPLLTDVHLPQQCGIIAACGVDILQIPAFLCRQTDLVDAAVRTGRTVNIKKGQFLSPQEAVQTVQKARDLGGKKLMLTERGSSYGYNTLINDFTGIPVMKEGAKVPIIFDATHSVQRPGLGGDKSLGNREFVPYLAKAACAVGVAGLFMEVHQDPDRAPSDGPNMVRLDSLKEILEDCLAIDKVIKKW